MAQGITEQVLEELKSRIEISDLIASYGIAVKTAGSAKKACCPFHHEKTPSFVINDHKGFYHCFGCGESGDAIKFVEKMEGLSFVESVKKLAARCGMTIEERQDPQAGRRKRLLTLLGELAEFYHRCLLKTKEAAPAREYLAQRDLDAEIQSTYLIGYAPSGVATVLKWAEKYHYTPLELEAAGVIKAPNRPGDRGYHRFGGRLMFSIRDKQGRVIGFSGRQLVASKNSGKYVNSPETEVFKKKNVLYGFDRAAMAITRAVNREVIVCEGQIDCIRLQTRGFPNAVAGQGTAFTDEHVAMLKKVADQVTLVYDDDAAGHKATIKSARLCLAAGLPVRVVSLPNGDDPDSFLRAHPAEEFKRMLDGAESIMAFEVRAERAKEAHPDSVDALSRITREILTTATACPNAVLRAAMTDEAARLLKVPVAAMNAELAKLAASAAAKPPSPVSTPDPEADDELLATDLEESEELPAQTCAEALPLPPKEVALMAFLFANEYDRTLDGMVGDFLPNSIFKHEFTVRFVETWRAEVVKGEDLFQDFAAQLRPGEQPWFDEVLVESDKPRACELESEEVLQDFIRSLWMDELNRQRGNLSANGSAADDELRLRLSLAIKRLARAKWHDVKDLVRNFIKGEY